LIVLPNFKQFQQKPTDDHAVFLHQLWIHSLWPQKTKFLFAYSNITVLLKLAFSAPDFHMLSLSAIF